ncbi:hypothetical protein CPT_Merlin218 [Citrobacter phage Merlin]|uniref:Uncharacterized protein n=1 Tax=Citrobacter phage Merlin TaxID=1675602 RepID=A0A0K1LN52_9CAUD|nr:hypothetical protein CPT_Merlin218 [Citrobacter phage Merlin]AKU43864.1 hypothetical protein CPT_Merlin218 [Citrobacter phage Merlin]
MKSIFRINGVEIVVEDVVPMSYEFNEVVFKELKKILGDKKLQSTPIGRFGMKENVDTYIESVVTGQLEGEFSVAVQTVENDEVILTLPAFVIFRK